MGGRPKVTFFKVPSSVGDKPYNLILNMDKITITNKVLEIAKNLDLCYVKLSEFVNWIKNNGWVKWQILNVGRVNSPRPLSFCDVTTHSVNWGRYKLTGYGIYSPTQEFDGYQNFQYYQAGFGLVRYSNIYKLTFIESMSNPTFDGGFANWWWVADRFAWGYDSAPNGDSALYKSDGRTKLPNRSGTLKTMQDNLNRAIGHLDMDAIERELLYYLEFGKHYGIEELIRSNTYQMLNIDKLKNKTLINAGIYNNDPNFIWKG